MLESLKELVVLIKDLPDVALWILGGFLFYKLSVMATVYKVIELAIVKTHDYFVQPKPAQQVVTTYDLGRHFIKTDESLREFLELIDSLKNCGIPGVESNFIHLSDIRWLRAAIAEKKIRAAEEKAKESERKCT